VVRYDTNFIYWIVNGEVAVMVIFSVKIRAMFRAMVLVLVMVKFMVMVEVMGKFKIKDMENMIPILYTGTMMTRSRSWKESWLESDSWTWYFSRSGSWPRSGSWSGSWAWSGSR
jgi:hypothetical protein